GTLTNSDAAETAFFPSMTITTLDADGKVNGLFTAYLNTDLADVSAVCQPDGTTDVPCLKPGQSLLFTIDTDLDPSEIDSFYDQIHWMETADFN
ncbi:MAG: hypothetical protein HZA19_03025, partial [Nitrospirae bacterium]|nr:hypothetical protein [Nitrospirota bacterium]